MGLETLSVSLSRQPGCIGGIPSLHPILRTLWLLLVLKTIPQWGGRGKISLFTFLFSLVRSMHKQIFPLCVTIDIGETQSVGSFIGVMTPSVTILANFSFTLLRRGYGILLGTVIANGFAPSFKVILYSPGIHPRPLKRLGYLFSGRSFSGLTTEEALVHFIKSKAATAGFPKSAVFWFSAKYTFCIDVFPWYVNGIFCIPAMSKRCPPGVSNLQSRLYSLYSGS